MAPAPTAEMEALVAYFQSCGLSATRSAETAKSKTSSAAHTLFQQNHLSDKNLSDKQGMLVLQIVTSKDGAKLGEGEKGVVVDRIADGSLKSADQVNAAMKYLTANPLPVDMAAFDKACGVGFSATPEEIITLVRNYVDSHKDTVTGWASFAKTSGQLRLDEGLRWAPQLEVKTAAEKVFEDVFGPKGAPSASSPIAVKTPAAVKGGGKAKGKEPSSEAAAAAENDKPEEMFATGWISRLHKPGENEQKIPARMEEHLKATGGKVFTRFPPEPNGFLHIGHSKAIAVNFGYAKYHMGHCYLRFDDTNPEAEKQEYFDGILEAVRWLGYEPYKITYSSDNFQKLYDLAVLMIKSGKAYTSDDSAADVQAQRGGANHGPRYESKDRSKPVEKSLAEFADMKAGKYKPGEMTLRLKQDLTSGNPVMWDIIAYRVLDTPHHRTGTDWKIYPTYDFTHCLCDSMENISHSLCTTEFILSREVYEWVCDALEVYKPRQSEYGRLSVEGTITSKRKLLKLIVENHVAGWDDPRLYTLAALKRRGVPPAALIAFVSSLGISTSSALVALSRFEQTVRQHLETTTPRLMMVLRPIRVTFSNLPADYVQMIEKPIHPKNPAMGNNTVPFTSTIFIDFDDFRTEASSEFFRLSPGATVGLLNLSNPITYVSHETDASGNVTSIVCRFEEDIKAAPKPKAYIHWVAEHKASNSPVHLSETRIFDRLFTSDDPANSADYISEINPSSLTVVKGSLIETGIWKVIDDSLEAAKKVVAERKEEAEKNGVDAPPQVDGLEVVRFQATRVAYFCLDKDSVLGGEKSLVLNRIAPLKAAKGA